MTTTNTLHKLSDELEERLKTCDSLEAMEIMEARKLICQALRYGVKEEDEQRSITYVRNII